MNKIFAFIAPVILLSIHSCSEDTPPLSIEPLPLTVDTLEVTFYSGEEHQIEALSDFPITYSSDNEYVATVSDSGLIQAQKVGESSIIVTSNDVTKKIPVEVLAKYKLYPEPILEWGMTRESIISEIGEPDASQTSSIGYTSYSPNAPMLMYLFDDNDKLKLSSVLVKTIFSADLGSFLSERYVYILKDNNGFLFINGSDLENTTMLISSTIYNVDYWMVAYAPNEESSKKSLGKNQSQTAIEAFKTMGESFYK